METTDLELNKPYKYPALCKIFNEKKKTGGAKQIQFKEWRRYYNIEKGEKATFIITKKYDETIEKIENRGKSEGSRGNYDGIYLQYTSALLLDYLHKETNDSILYETTNQIAQKINIINSNYGVANSNRDRFGKYMYKKHEFVNYTSRKDSFDALYEIVKPCVISTLNRLQDNGDITYLQTYLMYYVGSVRVATKEENEIIAKSEEEVMLDMKISVKQTLQRNNKLKNEFYLKVNKLVQSRIDIDFYCTGFKIDIKNKPYESIEDISEIKSKVNNIILKRAIKKVIKKQTTLDIVNPQKWDLDRMNVNFIIEASEIVHTLVSMEYKNVKQAIENTKVKVVIKKGKGLKGVKR